TAVFFLDQLYPLPKAEIAAAIDAHPNAREIVWVQEEPANMGALFYVLPRLERIAQAKNLRVRSVKRSASASPATGSAKAHDLEQKTLITLAFSAGVTAAIALRCQRTFVTLHPKLVLWRDPLMAFCKACGQEIGTAGFCPKCGANQASAVAPSAAPAANPTEGLAE